MVSQAVPAERGAVVCQAALAARPKNFARRATVSWARKQARSRRGGAMGALQQQEQPPQFGFNQEENDDYYKEVTVDDEYKSPPGSPTVELTIE